MKRIVIKEVNKKCFKVETELKFVKVNRVEKAD